MLAFSLLSTTLSLHTNKNGLMLQALCFMQYQRCLRPILPKYHKIVESTSSKTGKTSFSISEKPKTFKRESDNIFRPPRSENRKCSPKQ